MKTLMNCGWLVTMDPALGNLRNAQLLIDGDRVTHVGQSLDVAYDEVIDASKMIVFPGLTDAHVHLWQAEVRGLASNWLAGDYFEGMHSKIGPACGPRDNYLGNLLGALSYIDNGVTTILDYSHNLDSLEKTEASIDGLEESGIRAVFAPSPAHRIGEHPREDLIALRNGRLSSDDARVTMGLGLLGPVWATRDVVVDGINLARELGLLMSSHATFGDDRSAWPGGYVELAREGLLGPDHNLVHGNFIPDDELKEILDSGAALVATSVLEQQVGFPRPVVDRVRALGGLPALGTDVPSSVASDMFREMQSALQVVRTSAFEANLASGDAPLTDNPALPEEALAWATVGNARAMGLDGVIGRLAPGLKADIVAIRATDLNVFPVFDPVATIVGHAGTKNVDTVIIDGIVRKRGGELLFDATTLSERKGELLTAIERVIADSGVAEQPHALEAI